VQAASNGRGRAAPQKVEVHNFPAPSKEAEAPRKGFAAVSAGSLGMEATSASPAVFNAPTRPLTPAVTDGVSLGSLATSLQLDAQGERGPFSMSSDVVALTVQGELLTRLSRLVSVSGQVELKPERKRFRGRATEKPFGEGEAQMVRAKGSGTLWVEREKRVFVVVDLSDESAYFREDVVFAFEEAVVFENGRVPSDLAPDLDLVHLRGTGRVLLSLSGLMRSVPVAMNRPVTLPVTHLVGWSGNLTPKMVALTQDEKGKPLRSGLELSGDGFALCTLSMG
jgi:uncharacterized protein (AIM24 family)